MSNAKITYLGPSENSANQKDAASRNKLRTVSLPFLLAVVAPTTVAAIYYLGLATPAYVSEARFVVKQASREQPSALGFALQGVGISTTQTDAFSVHEYIRSPQAVNDLGSKINLTEIYGGRQADFLSKYPRPWEQNTPDTLHKAMKRYVTVSYDSSTGISTLKVKAFNPEDAQTIADQLLSGGEGLVNQLNVRANETAVREATAELVRAEDRLKEAQLKLTNFRNTEQIIDPARMATENSQLIGELMSKVAVMRAELTELMRLTPQSPEIEGLRGRIRAYEAQIDSERANIAGSAQSLATKLSTYEALALDREYAERAVATARATLDNNVTDARRQQLYLERIVSPNLPSDASEPRRLRKLLTVFLSLLVVYGVSWLVIAGIREHKQG